MNYPRFTKPSTPEERDEFLPFLKRLADAALKVILPNFLAGIRVDEKSNHTPVTLADRGAESAMRRMKIIRSMAFMARSWESRRLSVLSPVIAGFWIRSTGPGPLFQTAFISET